MKNADLPVVREDLLYYVWRLNQYDHKDLRTTEGERLQILDPGQRNDDSGPDFSFARIKIGDNIWIGHVEMHVRSSDWLRHNHQDNEAFSNVVLHVVFKNDVDISLPNDDPLACLELEGRIEPNLISTYDSLIRSAAWIPCEYNTRPISNLGLRSWYERVLVERILMKTEHIRQMLKATAFDWEEVFYRVLARNFGFNVNSDAFEALALATPRKIIIKHKDKLKTIEAILFGQAGLLEGSFIDSYALELQEEYRFIQAKHQLVPLQSQQWKFMRMRPRNFPTIRIAQFAVLLTRTTHLFSKMLAANSVVEIRNMFYSDVSWYWKEHYRFDQLTDKSPKKLGQASADLITINTIVPMLFLYAKEHQIENFASRSLAFLNEINPEKNSIISNFRRLAFPVESAFDSQALLQLKKVYCNQKRCLQCAIGHSIFKIDCKG